VSAGGRFRHPSCLGTSGNQAIAARGLHGIVGRWHAQASESVSREEARALWLGAGLATHVGLAIFEEPERFVTAAPSPFTPAAALAA
jgi:hypothetical protein